MTSWRGYAMAGAGIALAAACAYDLDPYRSNGQTGAGGGLTATSVSVGGSTSPSSGDATTSSANGATSSDAASTSSGGGAEMPFPFCNESDPLDDPDNWNDGNEVEFGGGQVKIGPDNFLSYLTWHDDIDVEGPCVFTVRLTSSLGSASFGVRKNSFSQFYMTTTNSDVHGPNPASQSITGTFPMTLAIIVTEGAIVTAFRDAGGWHRLDSIGKPDWLGDGVRPIMVKSGDDLYATFDEFNGDQVFPSDVNEPPLP